MTDTDPDTNDLILTIPHGGLSIDASAGSHSVPTLVITRGLAMCVALDYGCALPNAAAGGPWLSFKLNAMPLPCEHSK